MEEFITKIGLQVPALAVLVFLVIVFLRNQNTMIQLWRDGEQQRTDVLTECIDKQTCVTEKNTEVMVETLVHLRQLRHPPA